MIARSLNARLAREGGDPGAVPDVGDDWVGEVEELGGRTRDEPQRPDYAEALFRLLTHQGR